MARPTKQSPEEREYLEREGRYAASIDSMIREMQDYPDDHPMLRRQLELARQTIHTRAIYPDTVGGSGARDSEQHQDS